MWATGSYISWAIVLLLIDVYTHICIVCVYICLYIIYVCVCISVVAQQFIFIHTYAYTTQRSVWGEKSYKLSSHALFILK